MDDIHDMKGFYMANLSVQKSKLLVQNKILRRGYKYIYLTAYPPELNPVELEMHINDVTEVLG